MMLYLSQLISNQELSALLGNSHTGIELLDFSVGMNLDQRQTYLSQWKQQLRNMGNPRLTVHGPFLDLNPVSYDASIQDVTRLRFSQSYEAALSLGADKIIYHTCRVPQICYAQGWSGRMKEFFLEFLETHTELPVAVENVFDEDPYLIADFASCMDAPNFSLCLDIGHANVFSKFPLTEWIQSLRPWISHLHLHDNHGKTDDHLALGRGSIPWETILPSLEMLPHLSGITIENTSLEDFHSSLAYLSLYSEAAGVSSSS